MSDATVNPEVIACTQQGTVYESATVNPFTPGKPTKVIARTQQGTVYDSFPLILDADLSAETLNIQEEILNVGVSKHVLVLDNVYTHRECSLIISLSEAMGYESIENLYSKDYRNNERVMVQDDEFCATMFNRMKPFLDTFVPLSESKFSSYNSEKMEMIGLNSRLRVCRYLDGGVFKVLKRFALFKFSLQYTNIQSDCMQFL